jgi:hypothetical protein
LVHEFDASGNPAVTPRFNSLDTLAFPYVFPGAFSVPDSTSSTLGWLHGMPALTGGMINHAPLDTGDSLPIPDATQSGQLQTWWGFPTWRETASPNWLAPFKRINDPQGSTYFTAIPGTDNTTIDAPHMQAPGLSWAADPPFFLPLQNEQIFSESILKQIPPKFSNENLFRMPPGAVYEDDLLASNVRSFDVKGFDLHAYYFNDATGNPLPPGYYDLGYYAASLANNTPPPALLTLGHEGRIPPLASR